MPAATLTSKGQITLPAMMREKLRLSAGSKITFEEQSDGSFVVRKKQGDIRDVRGVFRNDIARALTVDEMNDAIAAAAVSRLDRGR